ncbi:MAG: phage terminase large subunit family protein [Planctomycetota bacterium]|jgi:hypothetical protein
MELTPTEIAEVDAPYWANLNGLLIDGRPFSMEGREYQFEMMRFKTEDGKIKHNEVIKKGSQTGATIGKSIEIAHGAKFGYYPQGIIYFFPSKTAVEEFSGSRFKPLLKDNHDVLGSFCNDINSVYTRRIGKTNVSFHGCSGTTIIGGMAKDSTQVRMTPADWILLDERDLFDDEMASQVNQRLGNSTIRRRSDMGTPKLPDDGVDRLYSKSDMRRWMIKCECRKYTCMETEFPECIKVADGRGFPVCIHCGREISRSNGSWEMDSPSRDTVGYWCSQLLNPNRDLAQVLKEYDDPGEYDTTEAEFQRTVLGKAFARAEDVLRETEVYQCCTSDQMAYSHKGPCAMGFDVGYPTIHVIIGHRIGNDRYRIVKLARVPDWGALHDLAHRFNVKATVGDAMPESHKIREWGKKEAEYGNTVYPCYCTPHLKTFDNWGTDNIVKVNHTDIFDESHQMVVNPGRMLIPRRCNEVDIFVHQMCNRAKFLETDTKGNVSYRYKKTGDKQDHYRSALNFFYLACRKVGVPEVHRRKKEVCQDMTYKL